MNAKQIPNLITSLNLATGCIAIVFAFEGNLPVAALLILLAAGFDFLDGLAARLLHAFSPLGKELDSLADIVSFGVAPGIITYRFLVDRSLEIGYPLWPAWFSLLIPVCSALRLARFNLDERQQSVFIGLPTPANALFWAFGLAFSYPALTDQPLHPLLFVPVILLFAWLLNSSIPMFSLKFHHFRWKENRQSYLFLLCCVLLVILFGWGGIPVGILLYVALSVALPLPAVEKTRKRSSSKTGHQTTHS
jgi:CDP-diacylglycerol--serine O-phosphatidyltransferase